MEAVAKLKKSPIAPRKMRLVADLIRGLSVSQAFVLLKHEPKKCAIHLEKLLLAAIASWHDKNQGLALAPQDLYIKTIQVDSAGMLKRLKPAPKGRAHNIRKRYNHVTLVVASLARLAPINTEETIETQPKKLALATDGTES
ncbi:MAG: 50S ribosomal protein L22 [Bacteroidota bacterium]